MRTKFKYLISALIAVFVCVSFTSCDIVEEDDPNKGIGNYYFQLSRVETNCIDANGNSIASTIKKEWIKANKADSQGKISIGKIDNKTAREWFNQQTSALVKAFNDAYAGKLPENGWIVYYFNLGSDAPYGGANESSIIEVTNSGARLR